tara:strand:- start:14581 stop:14994 length:414 start_codon:yes stop_codon:yes gene_type:complete
MKKEIFMKLIREMARGHGWQLGDRSKDWGRLFNLCEQLQKEDYTVKVVEDGIAHANEIHPQYMPTNPMLLRCIKTAHENEKRARRIDAQKGSKSDFERWQQEMARCAQWNREHHEDIIQDRVKPKMADPAIAFGKKS